MSDQVSKELSYIVSNNMVDSKILNDLKLQISQTQTSPLEYLLDRGVISESQLIAIRNAITNPSNPFEANHSFRRNHQENDMEATLVKKTSDESLTYPLSGSGTSENDEKEFAHVLNIIDRKRFEVLERLGKGGMGIVFKAYDYQLERHVAIKVLLSQDPESMTRFIREARAQACVDHEHICKVFEVGQSGANPYIVMQFIDGEKLDVVCENMPFEQRLLVMKQIAYGVHEAHRMGLIHRDLKPANIMVMRTEDGRYRPFVLDFGLARFGYTADVTMVGDVIGTPAYMAPEQAMGLGSQLDRRTDVYALGATMYRILTGSGPVKGDSGGEVLVNLQTTEPQSPRLVNSAIPKDIEIITMKCLERKPDDRYPSARALADDLGRFLDGDPILAKPPGFFYKLGKRVVKHRAIVALGSVAALLALSFATYMVYARWQVGIRERLAAALTQKVEEVESMSRHTYLTRRHNIADAREKLNETMVAIQGEIQQAGSLGRGLGLYALGRAHLILGQSEQAEHHLQNAWDEGYQEPRVAYALGLALGERYRSGLDAAQLLDSRIDRNRYRQTLKETFLDRARQLIKLGAETETRSSTYYKALLAYYDDRLDDALNLIEHDTRSPAWFYEIAFLKGEILREMASKSAESGSIDTAKTQFYHALNAYEQARRIGESDPRIYLARCKVYIQMITMGVFGSEDVSPYLQDGLRDLEWALEIMPNHAETWLLKTKLHRNMAQRLKVQGQNPLSELELAEQAAACALQLKGDRSEINLELGIVNYRWAQWLEEKRQKPLDKINLALAHLEQVDPKDHNFNYFHTLGTLEMTHANGLVRAGEDAQDAYAGAIAAFTKASDRAPEQYGIYNSLAVCLFRLSEQPNIRSKPVELLQEGVDALQMAIQINPNHVVLHYQLGRTYFRLAQNGRPLVGTLNETLVEKALEHYERALEINPKMVHLYNVLGMAHYFRGIYSWEAGKSSNPWFQKAIATYEKGLKLVPNARRLHQNMAWVYYYQGKIKLRQGDNPTREFQLAKQHTKKAITQGEDLEALLCLASMDRLLAEHHKSEPEVFEAYRHKAQQGFEKILERNPNYAEAHRSLGRLHSLSARRIMKLGGEPAEKMALGRQALDKALALEKQSPYVHLADARWHILKVKWQTALGKSTAPAIEAGRKSVKKALDLRPEFGEATLAGAAFNLFADIDQSQQQKQQTEIRALLKQNPHLSHDWKALIFSSL